MMVEEEGMMENLETMIAYCGITCTDCPAYIAGLEKVAAEWSKGFDAEITADARWNLRRAQV